jgi:hypothetical protein
MKTFAMAAAGAAFFGTALVLSASTEAQNAAATGIPGFLNPATGVFTARPVLLPAVTGLQRAGTVTVTVTAVLGTNIPTSLPLTCAISLSTFDSIFDNSAGGSGVLVRSGKGGTCKVAIPYIFEIASAATTMTVSASIFASTETTPILSYSASHSFTPFTVPNGSTSLAVTLAM